MDIIVMVRWASGVQVPFISEYNHYINFLLSSCYWPLLFKFVRIGWCWAWTNKRLRYDYRLRPAMWLSNAQLLNQRLLSASQRLSARAGMFLITYNYQFLLTAIQQPFHSLCTEHIKKDKGFPFGWGNSTWTKTLCTVGEILIADDI